MRTDDLIRRLAADLPAGTPAAGRPRLGLGRTAAMALVLTVPLSALIYGLRADLGAGEAFGVVFWAATAAAAVWAASRLARPEPAPLVALIGPLAALLCAVGLMAWLGRGEGVTVFRADHVAHCAEIIGLLSLPPFLWLSVVMRRGAPASPRAAGATIGLIAGAIAALAYTLNCPIGDALAALSAHTVSVLLVSALGAVVGPSVFSW
ncbi:MAG: NrsF family protein [Pseudomonadota bacterium]